MGALVDDSQKKTIDEYVEDARKEGAEVIYENLVYHITQKFYEVKT